MIAAAFLHMLRILLSGAYKKPRELNYLVGLGLLGLAVVTAFTGYALPYDNYAVTATRIGYGIAHSIPWIGGALADLMFAGSSRARRSPSLGFLASTSSGFPSRSWPSSGSTSPS